MKSLKSKIYSVGIIAAIYLSVFLSVYCFFPLLHFPGTMINVFFTDVIATAVIFIFSMILSNSSVYDPYWSVVPPVIAIYLVFRFPEANRARQLVVVGLILFWGFRLTLNWLRGWQGLRHQDWRYTSIAQKTGKKYWFVSFFGIHFMPTVFVFLGCLPLWYSLSAQEPFTFLDAVALVFTLSAILTEWIADEQLHRFRKKDNRNTFIQSGLWLFSRHPNYLGEISFWAGMFLFVLSASGFKNAGGYWTVIGLVSMILLFTLISIPLMEKRNRDKKPGYAEYAKKVPSLLPRFFSNGILKNLPQR
jgi:steroid 5-alpha reductase family enzyme